MGAVYSAHVRGRSIAKRYRRLHDYLIDLARLKRVPVEKAYRIIGIDSSPYTVKVRAFMRYKRILHQWVARMPQFFEETQDMRPLLMPVVQFPDGNYHIDSTPIMRQLDGLHGADRSVCPASAALAFLNDLIEDFADEWLTKSLFHYRFSTAVDSAFGASWVMDDCYPSLDAASLKAHVEDFTKRQHERRELIGCTPVNATLFEACFADLVDSLEGWVATDRFLFGSRPASADFALYGQLRTLSIDPTPATLMRARTPRLRHWLGRVDDLSGAQGHWLSVEAALPRVEPLLVLCGRYYLPFLQANFNAISGGKETVQVDFGGHLYKQAPFRYQAKCYAQLAAAYEALPEAARVHLVAVLERTGCASFLPDA